MLAELLLSGRPTAARGASTSERMNSMNLLHGVAAFVLFFEMPIPLFWLVLHPQVHFWRHHVRAAYTTAMLVAWGAGGAFLYFFREELFVHTIPPAWAILLGFVLILLEGWIFARVHRDLGGARLVGQSELSGGGELAETGIYARVRHPRYTGMFAAVAGACLLGGTLRMWLVAALWLPLALLAIALEERELRARFGGPYADYCRRVPRFLPFRLWPRAS
jgi:protein-S-isoprenylcysteine O-methyltransferase Ste14